MCVNLCEPSVRADCDQSLKGAYCGIGVVEFETKDVAWAGGKSILRRGGQRQGVENAAHPVAQRIIHHFVLLHPRLAFELSRWHNEHASFQLGNLHLPFPLQAAQVFITRTGIEREQHGPLKVLGKRGYQPCLLSP